MNEIFTLEDLQNQVGIRFSKDFWDIYNTGVMEWMTHSPKWVQAHQNELLDEDSTAFFYNVTEKFKPLLFREIKGKIDYISELATHLNLKINSDYKLIPFAVDEKDNLFCFCYKEYELRISNLVSIVQLEHTTGNFRGWTGAYNKELNSIGDFIFLQLALAVIESDNPENTIANSNIYENSKFLVADPFSSNQFETQDIKRLKEILEDIKIPTEKDYKFFSEFFTPIIKRELGRGILIYSPPESDDIELKNIYEIKEYIYEFNNAYEDEDGFYWNQGNGGAILKFYKDDKLFSTLLICPDIDNEYGFCLKYSDNITNVEWVSLNDRKLLHEVTESADDWFTSVGFFLTVEKTWIAVEEFGLTGLMTGEIEWIRDIDAPYFSFV